MNSGNSGSRDLAVKRPRTAGRPFLPLCRCVISCLLLAAVCIAGDSEWPHQRGGGYSGFSAERFPAGELAPRIAWSRTIGDGFSGFVVSGTRAVGQVQQWDGQYLVCLNTADGTPLWRRRYERPWDVDGDYPGPYATPTIAGRRVFFAGCRGTIGCVDLRSGNWLWRRDLADEGVAISGFGYASTPLVVAGRVFCPGGDEGPAVVAYDAHSGDVVWRAREEAAGFSSCIPFVVGGVTQVVGFLENAIVGLDPAGGAELWRSPWSHGYDPHPAWPIGASGRLLCTAPFRRGSRCLELSRTGDGWLARTVWESDVLCCDVLSPIEAEGYLYGYDLESIQADEDGQSEGTFRCVELATGRLCWSTDTVAHASVVGWGTHLAIWTDAGTLVVSRRSPDAYTEEARLQVLNGALCWTPPAIAGELLLLRGGDKLVAVRMVAGRGGTLEGVDGGRPMRRAPFGSEPRLAAALLWGVALLVCVGAVAHRWGLSRYPILLAVAVAGSVAMQVAGTDGSALFPLAPYVVLAALSESSGGERISPGERLRHVLQLMTCLGLLFALLYLGWLMCSEFLVAAVACMLPAPLILRVAVGTGPAAGRRRTVVDAVTYAVLCALAFLVVGS